MSQSEQQIVCRRCDEPFPIESGSCPHCGTGIRGDTGPIAIILIGAVLSITSLLSIGELWFFGLVGVAMIAAGGYILREKRQRMREASERSAGESGSDSNEAPEISLE